VRLYGAQEGGASPLLAVAVADDMWRRVEWGRSRAMMVGEQRGEKGISSLSSTPTTTIMWRGVEQGWHRAMMMGEQ
jgi:hypothetical protein